MLAADEESGDHTVELQPMLDAPVQPPLLLVSRGRQSSKQPLLPKDALATMVHNLILICTWYFFSTCLSLWNRQLVGRGHGILGLGPFPAPMLITSAQFACQHLLARLVIGLRRLRNGASAEMDAMTWQDWWQKVVPNGVSTGLDIGLSNYSLMLITLSFYTMCKSATPVFLLVFAFVWGLERPSWGLAGVVVIIALGLLLLVAGETEFDLVGFLVVMGASMLAGFRWTITQVLLQGDRHHGGAGGPLHVLYHLTPVMSVTVLVMSLLVERLWQTLPTSPYFVSLDSLGLTAAIMVFGGVIAFVMVWTEFSVIQQTSALTFMVAGTFKEIVTVMAAVAFLGERFTVINGVGLCILIAGVVLFNFLKYRKIRAGEVAVHTATPRKSIVLSPRRPPDGAHLLAEDSDGECSTPPPGKLSTPVQRNPAAPSPFAIEAATLSDSPQTSRLVDLAAERLHRPDAGYD